MVYHPPFLHRDPRCIHLMVTRQATRVLHLVDRLVLSVTSSPSVSPMLSFVHSALGDSHW
jgi:hypothetical protein